MAESSSRNLLWRSIASGTIGHIWGTYVFPALLPVAASTMTMVLGWFAHPAIPWMYIWATTTFVLAMSSAAVLWLGQISEKYRVKGKMNFHQIRFTRGASHPGIGLGVSMMSSASFPIEFNVESCSTEINNTLPKERKFARTNYEIPPNGWGFFDGHLIEIVDVPKLGTLEGFAEFKIKYGKVGALKHDLLIKKQVVLQFDQNGHLTGGIWNDAVE